MLTDGGGRSVKSICAIGTLAGILTGLPPGLRFKKEIAMLSIEGDFVMTDDYLVRNCAPALAGIKTGSLFTCPYESKEALLQSVRQLNRRLSSKGLRVLPLRLSERNALIYIFRPQCLSRDLKNLAAKDILRQYGYDTESCERCVVRLIQKLRTQKDFPHEIGLFLGYPPEDVCGFIENKACNCKCVGCWKVYGDEKIAQKKFAQYKKCTEVYCRQWAKGRGIERLAVAAAAG